MTKDQAKQFWDEWQAFKGRWKFDAVVTTNEDCEARFGDGSFIRIDSSNWDGLSAGDLKDTETPIADMPSLPVFHRAQEGEPYAIMGEVWNELVTEVERLAKR